jgi:hypothetical protein
MSVVSYQSSIVSHRWTRVLRRTTDHGQRTARSALSLTEVLIAMGILTLGLLGVASIFPVASFYMHKADLEDRGSAIARSVMNDIVARGMLNPRSWYAMIPPATFGLPASNPFPSDGQYAPVPPNNRVNLRGTFNRPFAQALNDALNQPAAATDRTLIGKQFGSAFVIDPTGVASMSIPSDYATGRNLIAYGFPSAVYSLPLSTTFYGWQSWGTMWPIRRVTFQQPGTFWQMDTAVAEHFFQGNDDLSSDLPDRDDRPATQNWDTQVNASGIHVPTARQWVGDYSWIVTVVPATSAARNGMARNPEGFAYDVSVVVFYKRALPAGPPATTTEAARAASLEQAVKATVLSSGLNGGELLLERLPGNDIPGNPFDELRIGQWIMLCGPHPNSSANTSAGMTSDDPRFVLNWYQLISVEGKGERLNNQGTTTPSPSASEPERRLVAVRGPQWPWQPNASSATNLCVGICRGAVAVHTKTLRLEGPRGPAMKLVTPPNVPPNPYSI